MAPLSLNPDELLDELEGAKGRFGRGQVAHVAKVIGQLSRVQFDDLRELIRFHECLLFLRAFPQGALVVARVESALKSFRARVERLAAANADMSVFDDFDTSGIAGTTMQDTLSFDVAQWLVRRIPHNVEVAWEEYWDDYQAERARGYGWPRFIPLLGEDADVEANIPWSRWLEAARGRRNALPWILERFAELPMPGRQRSELYDSLRIPIRWRLETLKISRTLNWRRPKRFYFHDGPLIQRSEVSLEREFARPAPKLEKLSLAGGEAVMKAIRKVMVVRYRELYGTTLGDPRTVVRADVGRGVVMHFWGLPRERRLPLRAYIAGYTLKNGVPINYIEAIGLCEWMEVGFNTFYTYRQGETAWIYAQALRCLSALAGMKCISIYPYQIGANNEEAIDSGAFWFYRKLGFRPGRSDLQELCVREEKRIAADSKYRTPRRTLKRLAEAHMFYEVETAREKRGEAAQAEASGDWDRFSVRNLGLLVNRRMAQRFSGDSRKIRRASIELVARALKINLKGWNEGQKQSLENWSLVLALMPDLVGWPVEEKRQLVEIIRSKSAINEMDYIHKTQRHLRLREELLRLGS
jgi:hypothetical protein